jgi:uncharacterized protein
MFTLDVDRITEEGLTVDWKEEPGVLSSYLGNFSQIDFHFETALDATATVWKVGQSIMVKGSLRAQLRLQCVRCLEEFSYPLSSTFEVALFPAKEASFEEEEEVELGEDEMESNFYEGGEIHLSEIACEQIFLEIPYQPVCHEDCKGLCPVCGKDLNRAPCDCRREEFETGFAVLKKLKLDN